MLFVLKLIVLTFTSLLR